MRIPGLKRLRAAYRWGRSRFRSRAMILGYHRIATMDPDPYGLCVSPENFRHQLEELLSIARPVRLSEMVSGLEESAVEPGTVALTFDDAYLETLAVAQPILEELGIPATVFVVTSFLGREPWWDRLLRLLWEPPALPDRLELHEGDFDFLWSPPDGAAPRGESDPGTARMEILMELHRRLLGAREEDRELIFERLSKWTAAGLDAAPSSRVLSAAELREIASSALIEIGSHTVSHPLMASLTPEEQEWEVASSRTFLESLLERNVSFLSYPNGSRTPATEEIVQRAGFAAACGSLNDVVTVDSNRYHLPRFWPSDSPTGLSRPLNLWLGD